jgi:hypothetical protein
MSEKYEWKRCDTHDPNRCQATSETHGQCPFLAVPESKFCPRHGGNKALEAARKENARLYLSAQWQARIGAFAEHPKARSLKEELGILRMLLENKLNLAKDNTQLEIMSGGIQQACQTIEKLAKTCHAIEKDYGKFLDITQARELANNLVTIIASHIDDPEKLQIISDELMTLFEQAATA